MRRQSFVCEREEKGLREWLITSSRQNCQVFFIYDVSRRRRAIKVCHIISWLSRYPTNSVETLRQDSLTNKTRKKGQSTKGKRNYSRFLLKEVGMLMRGKFVEWRWILWTREEERWNFKHVRVKWKSCSNREDFKGI